MSEIDFLAMLSAADYIEMYEVIDDDGIRKSALKATNMSSAFDDPRDKTNRIMLTVNWRLLDKWKEPKTSYTEKMILGEEDKAIAWKAAKLISRDYGKTIKELGDA